MFYLLIVTYYHSHHQLPSLTLNFWYISLAGEMMLLSLRHLQSMLWQTRRYDIALLSARAFTVSTRQKCSQTIPKPKLPTLEDDFSLVYRFPHIATVRGLARLKLYTTAVMLLFLPPYHFYAPVTSTAFAHDHRLLYAGMIAALINLYYIGNVTRKLVGVISIHEDGKHVRIGRLTFWGNRRNIIVPIDSIIPLSEGKRSIKDIYTDVKSYDGSVDLHIALRYGGIHDMDNFEFIFGKLIE